MNNKLVIVDDISKNCPYTEEEIDALKASYENTPVQQSPSEINEEKHLPHWERTRCYRGKHRNKNNGAFGKKKK
jgi:hypothetical protein